MANTQTKGELLILGQVAIFGFFPVIAYQVTRLMPPVLFIGLCTLVAAVALFIFMLMTGQFKRLPDRQTIFYIFGVAIFTAVVPNIFIFTGASMTSSINVSLFWQMEIFFTFIICAVFAGEKITRRKILGSLAVLIGATVVLYNGKLTLNPGDILVIVGTVFFPVGNIYGKKALRRTTPSMILLFRSIAGGFMLLAFSLMFETYQRSIAEYFSANLLSILLSGVVVFLISKLMWYEGLKTTEISKGIALALSAPGFTMVYAAWLLKEFPTIYQVSGLVIIILGLFILTRQPSRASVPVQ